MRKKRTLVLAILSLVATAALLTGLLLMVKHQPSFYRRAELPRRLSLGEGKIVYTVFRHEARGGGGNAGPDAGLASALACHGTGPMIALPRAVPE